MKSDYRLATILAHAGIKSDKAAGALTAPIHFSTTCQHPEFGESIDFDYTRTKNPTRATLERTFATIKKADYALAISSGMSAIVLVFEVSPIGVKVVAVRDLYGGSFRWLNDKKREGRFSLEYTNTEVELLAAISGDMDIVYTETLMNSLMVEFDIGKVTNVAHVKGAKLIADNTFYSPTYQNPIPLGTDIVMHSATRYLAGHNDALADVMIVNDREAHDKLLCNLSTVGPTLSPFDFYMLIRELGTLRLRMKKSTENTRDIVVFLEELPAAKEVLYTGKGGMISSRVVGESKIPDIINSLDITTFAENPGDVGSLVTYPRAQTHADIPEKVRSFYGLTSDLLRLFIGIEDVEDLIDNLEHASEA